MVAEGQRECVCGAIVETDWKKRERIGQRNQKFARGKDWFLRLASGTIFCGVLYAIYEYVN
jgi:hypothetical protein